MNKRPKKYRENVKGHYRPSTGVFVENYNRDNIHHVKQKYRLFYDSDYDPYSWDATLLTHIETYYGKRIKSINELTNIVSGNEDYARRVFFEDGTYMTLVKNSNTLRWNKHTTKEAWIYGTKYLYYGNWLEGKKWLTEKDPKKNSFRKYVLKNYGQKGLDKDGNVKSSIAYEIVRDYHNVDGRILKKAAQAYVYTQIDYSKDKMGID